MKKTALITGGAKGIGKALAVEFAKNGYDLILIARDEKALREAQAFLQDQYQVVVKYLALDLEKAESIDAVVNEFQEELKELDVLVNNAGFGLVSTFIETSKEALEGMVKLNMAATTYLTHRILPYMVARKSGKILNVASTAAFTPGPYYSIYYATKAYVFSFSYALAVECEKLGVSVSVLCPGVTVSGFHDRSRASNQHIRLLNSNILTAEKVARDGYDGLMRGKRIIVPGLVNKILYWAMVFTPVRLKAFITAYLNQG